jgi:prefoldin subunit 5
VPELARATVEMLALQLDAISERIDEVDARIEKVRRGKQVLEPIQEEWIHAEWFVRVKRRSMMRIMARRKKAATVLV